MKIFIAVVSCISLFGVLLQAQSDYRPGFIITLQGDTVSGMVAFQSNRKNNAFCKFKPSKNSSAVVYQPSDIVAYGFEKGRKYEADLMRDSTGVEKDVFFQVLVQGAVSLLEYNQRFFMRQGNEAAPKELTTRKEDRTTKGYKRKITVKTYLNDLYSILKNCSKPTITAEAVNKSELSQASLVPIFAQINACLDAAYTVYNSEQPWLGVHAGVMGGVTASQLEFRQKFGTVEVTSENFVNSTFHTSLPATFGAFLNFYPAKINERISFQIEAWYTQTQYEGYSTVAIAKGIRRNNIYVEVAMLKVPFLLSYRQSLGSLQLHYRGGIATHFKLQGTARRVVEEEIENVVYTQREHIGVFNEIVPSVSAGLALSKNITPRVNVLLELRYVRGRDLFYLYRTRGNIAAQADNFSILLGLSF